MTLFWIVDILLPHFNSCCRFLSYRVTALNFIHHPDTQGSRRCVGAAVGATRGQSLNARETRFCASAALTLGYGKVEIVFKQRGGLYKT